MHIKTFTVLFLIFRKAYRQVYCCTKKKYYQNCKGQIFNSVVKTQKILI